MRFNKFSPILLSFGLSTIAGAAGLPVRLPALNALSFPLSTPMSLPTRPLPIIAPTILPEPFAIDWSRLKGQDGDDAATVLIPNNPGPRPLTPSGALNVLSDVASVRALIQVVRTKAFDGRREVQHEIVFSHDHFF